MDNYMQSGSLQEHVGIVCRGRDNLNRALCTFYCKSRMVCET